MSFNPFDTPIGQKLTEDDLQQLITRGVAEGYVVEYKSDFPKNHKIAYSLASFANTYGGWYIVGVETDSNNVATRIVGYNVRSHPDGISKIREIAKQIDPVPILYPQVIDLSDNLAVLVVYIPGEQDAPFITRDGRIYRRIHDSSDPVPESNRYAIDRLIDQGKSTRNRFKQFCKDDRAFSEDESGQPWLNLYLSLCPGGVNKFSSLHLETSLEELLVLGKSPMDIPFPGEPTMSGNIPFNVVQVASRSVILRQVNPGRAAYHSLTVELYVDGRAKCHIPLAHHGFDPTALALESVTARRVLERLWTQDQDYNFYQLRFIDVGALCLQLAILVSFYKQWLGELPSFTEIEFAASFVEVWRSVPFVDADIWGQHVETYGLPVIGSNNIWVGVAEDRGYRVPWNGETPEWLEISGFLFLGFGIPVELYAHTLAHAMWKAMKQQKEGTHRITTRLPAEAG